MISSGDYCSQKPDEYTARLLSTAWVTDYIMQLAKGDELEAKADYNE
ncbi:hypothetical protein [Acidilobus sp.]